MLEPTDKLERQVAAAFAEVLRPQPGDEAKLAGMIGAALKPPPGGGPAPSTGGVAGKLWPALMGGLGGAAVAVVLLSGRGEPTPSAVAAVAPSTPVAAAPVVAPPPEEEEPLEPIAAPEVPGPLTLPVDPGEHGIEMPTAQRPKRRASVAVTPPIDVPEPPEDPDALLRAANQARRARSFAEADRLYSDLQARFPDSRAARTSRVPHGRVLLDTLGRPADALNCFSAYLAGDPRGTLAEEALVGRAQALEQMGRDAQARDAWRSLFERFPESVHAPAAQSRLAEAGP